MLATRTPGHAAVSLASAQVLQLRTVARLARDISTLALRRFETDTGDLDPLVAPGQGVLDDTARRSREGAHPCALPAFDYMKVRRAVNQDRSGERHYGPV